MTISEFIEKLRQHRRRTCPLGFLVMVSWFGFAFVSSNLFRENPLLFVATFITYFVVSCVGLRSWARRSIDQLSLDCPGCSKWLIGRKGRRSEIVIATGRCGACGARVLEDAEK